MNQPNIIQTVDALAGAGKTYDAIRWALMEASTAHRKTVMVFKSKELIEQAFADAIKFRDQHGWTNEVTEIHSNLHEVEHLGRTVTEMFLEHLEQTTASDGELLMITEAAFLALQHWPNRYLWTCICDEIPDVTPAIKKNLPVNHHLLTQHLQLIPMGDKYSEVGFVTGGKQALTEIAENPSRDEVNQVLSQIAKRLISPIYTTHVLTAQFNRLINQVGKPRKRQLEVFSLLQPTVFGADKPRSFQANDGSRGQADMRFAEVIIMGAAVEISMLRRIWPAMDVQFVQHEQIGTKPRYSKHTCGDRLSIQYVFETDWSKSFAGKTSTLDGSEITNFDVLQYTCDVVLENQPFVYLINKDREKRFKTHFIASGTQLPNSPWGLNRYQGFHNAAVLSALNPTPPHLGFLDHLCQNSYTVRDALFHSQIYQAVMRSSLRDINATEQVQVLVPDRSSAAALAKYFPGCSCKKLPLDLNETSKKKVGAPKLSETRPAQKSTSESHKRNRSMDKEIKRIKAGGVVDEQLLEQFQTECRSDNQTLQKLLEVIEENR